MGTMFLRTAMASVLIFASIPVWTPAGLKILTDSHGKNKQDRLPSTILYRWLRNKKKKINKYGLIFGRYLVKLHTEFKKEGEEEKGEDDYGDEMKMKELNILYSSME